MKKNKLSHTNFNYRFIYFPYLIAGCFFIYFLRYYIDGVDMLNYISLSKKYVDGNIYDAINDYWSPMIPWLLTPFIVLNIDPFLAFHILQLLIGIFTIKISLAFIEPMKIKMWMKNSLRFSFIPLVLSYGQLYGSPDLLFLTVLLFYLKIISDDNYCSAPKAGIKTGIWAGLLFLTKAFGFPFFIVHFTAMNLFFWFGSKPLRKIILKNFINGFAVFTVITGAWIGVMSYKNKAFTISGSGKYNFSLVGPEYSFKPECYLCHPAHEQGLFNPPNTTAVNSTESPSLFHIHTWSPFSTSSNFKHWLRVIKTNLQSIYYFDFKRQIGVVLFIAFLIFFSFKLNTLPKRAWVLLISILIYNIGYVFVIVNHRYIWVNTIVFIVLFCFLLEPLISNNKTKFVTVLLFCFFVFFLVKRPLKELFLLKDRDVTAGELAQVVMHSISTITNSTQQHKHLFDVIEELKDHTTIRGRVANHKRNLSEDYKNTAVISFYLGNKHYGELTDAIIQHEGFRQLHDYQIDYYYSWKSTPITDSLILVPPIYSDSISGLKIYKVKK